MRIETWKANGLILFFMMCFLSLLVKGYDRMSVTNDKGFRHMLDSPIIRSD